MSRARPTLTTAQPFSVIGGKPLFSVNADVPAVDALEHASCLMECAARLSLTVATETAEGGEAFAVHYLAEMVKALIDSCASGAFYSEVKQ
ncbi:MAG: DUF3077 domain-containing protein [Pseudomonas sp.]|uniref:DUF3077 domain-containing protein n=1 Tax=Pseudomonas sp. TaxID=306 RepID=UPI0027350EB0|nr:DUF3077 domain-containing protein [Pseudomonas sp.]MDP3845529.1 DUF3077 domain-containing protein [Pseudomonas sp.]